MEKNRPLKVNDQLPAFISLPGIDGKTYSSGDFSAAKITVIVFSCNHCPYVQAYEDRMMAFVRRYVSKGVEFVAINSNDEVNYPDDSFESMVVRAKAKGFNYPYLRDRDQTVANAFGATHTPQFFVFDENRRLRYSGKMDDNWKDASAVKENFLQDAVEQLLAGRDVPVPETFSIGCTIKWR